MPYNRDGFYIENEPSYSKDCTRRLERDCERRREIVARLDRILSSRRCPSWARELLADYRRDLIVELHDDRRAYDKYDRAFAEACDDPTGQDLDVFCDSH